MVNAEAKTVTRKLFGSFLQNRPHQRPSRFQQELAEGYEKPVMAGMLRLYTAALADFSREEIVLAFSRATEECKFFPSPATLREFSGRVVSGDPLAAEAKAELLKLLAGMRGPHGPFLQPILGAFLYGKQDDPKDEDGQRCAPCDAPRAESTPFPIASRTEAALVRLGWGSREAGIALLADHPTLARSEQSSDPQYRQNHLRASVEQWRATSSSRKASPSRPGSCWLSCRRDIEAKAA